jgi:hypothetical protein
LKWSRCRRLCTEVQRLVGLNYRRWKSHRKKNKEAIQTESSALTDEIQKKNEEAIQTESSAQADEIRKTNEEARSASVLQK